MSVSLTKEQSDKQRCWEKKHGPIELKVDPNSPLTIYALRRPRYHKITETVDITK